MRVILSYLFSLAVVLSLGIGAPNQPHAAERADVAEFLEVTGFDVSLEALKLSAESAPLILGLEAEDFGFQWTLLTREVFDTDLMHQMAIDILAQTLSQDLLDHAAGFYASDLGQRLVEVENASHLEEDDTLKGESGEAIVAGLERLGSPRIETLKRMNIASDSAGNAVRAIQEVQVRFIMAAVGAGVIRLRMDEQELRAMLKEDEDKMRASLQESSLAGAAYTYQAFSDAEVETYTQALENPKMREVYNLMNAVQFEVQANRFEELARRMSGLKPSEDL